MTPKALCIQRTEDRESQRDGEGGGYDWNKRAIVGHDDRTSERERFPFLSHTDVRNIILRIYIYRTLCAAP